MVILQRVCWNSRGWTLPTGSTNESGFPGKHGFGHEEWNFQMSDTFNGYIYGYTYTRPSRAVCRSHGTFDIGFFTIHPTTNQRLLVGIYKDAELINDSEYSLVYQSFLENGIIT